MIAIAIAKPGGPEVLQPIEMRVRRRPGPREVLIDVDRGRRQSARPDAARGEVPASAGATDIPGLEVSGTIVACGPGSDALARRR